MQHQASAPSHDRAHRRWPHGVVSGARSLPERLRGCVLSFEESSVIWPWLYLVILSINDRRACAVMIVEVLEPAVSTVSALQCVGDLNYMFTLHAE